MANEQLELRFNKPMLIILKLCRDETEVEAFLPRVQAHYRQKFAGWAPPLQIVQMGCLRPILLPRSIQVKESPGLSLKALITLMQGHSDQVYTENERLLNRRLIDADRTARQNRGESITQQEKEEDYAARLEKALRPLPTWLICTRLQQKGGQIMASEDANIQTLLTQLRAAVTQFQLDKAPLTTKKAPKLIKVAAAPATLPAPPNPSSPAQTSIPRPPTNVALEDLCLPAEFVTPDQHAIAMRSIVASDKSNHVVFWVEAGYPSTDAAIPHMRDVLGTRGKGFPRLVPVDINTPIDLQAMHNPDVLVKTEKVYSDPVLNDAERRLAIKNKGGRLQDLAKA
jgi:hypothetical protein